MTVYTKKTLHQHILDRPDSYVGQVKPEDRDVWVPNNNKFVKRTVRVSPALTKVFDEILVNALDQSSLNTSVTKISIDVDESGRITIANNGISIPVVIHEQTQVWTPELIFGHLLTSSNYDDSEERTTGGRNGYGAKLTNIYSKEFEIKVDDPETRKSYHQVWRDNMRVCAEPKIKSFAGKTAKVQVSWVPDWERFGLKGITKDVKDMFMKRALDAAAWVPTKCKVHYNGEVLAIKHLQDYTSRFTDQPLAQLKQDRWEVLVCSSAGAGFKQISFVNGICTEKGGTHVDHVVNQITSDLAKKTKLRPSQVKQCMLVVVKAVLVNPSFSSQSKHECMSRVQDFGSKFEPTPAFLKQVKGVLEQELLAQTKASEVRDLKKTDGAKKSRISGIPKLDDANWAGTTKSKMCTLIITEGDSAKALAISGLSVVGRDQYGVFPLKGKPRNVRDLGSKALTANQEFSDLKKILGLQQGKKYSDLTDLRYGRLMIMTDADVDGSHIKGLVLNMFDCYWPELITMGFVVSMITPVIRVKGGRINESFYSERDFVNWLEQTHQGRVPRGVTIKYYKGLGTSTSAEAKEYFRDLGRLTVGFVADQESQKSVGLAFDKSLTDDRKRWLAEPFRGDPLPYGKVTSVTVSDFIHKDLIQFSHADIRRSIPDVRDGLKPSQRKVIYGCIKRNLTSEVKVAQLSGYISEHTAYHHGEMSLQGTIVGLAQDFMGSNNMNLLEPCGQFGTRLAGGSDHASARYIFTRLSNHAKVFDERDNACLTYLKDDGKPIEPEYYLPTMPMILVNGAEGIGTGFSCKVPPHNPMDVKENLKRFIRGESLKPMKPWFRGFKGTVTASDEGVWTLAGVWQASGDKVEVSELPPGTWTQTYKEFLVGLVEKNVIKNYSNHSTEEDVRFVITGYKGSAPEKDLKLTSTIRSTNMYLHGPNGIEKFDTPLDILRTYATERMALYDKRKKYLVATLAKRSGMAMDRANFVKGILDGSLRVMGLKKADAEENMLKKFKKVDGSFEHLWGLKTSRYTQEAVQELMQEARVLLDELKRIQGMTTKDMWLEDLNH